VASLWRGVVCEVALRGVWHARGVACARRGVAWRGVAWHVRGVARAWRGVARCGVVWRGKSVA